MKDDRRRLRLYDKSDNLVSIRANILIQMTRAFYDFVYAFVRIATKLTYLSSSYRLPFAKLLKIIQRRGDHRLIVVFHKNL